MPVEDVFRPKTIAAIDPRVVAEKEDGDEYWTRKAREARARLDYQEYEHAMQQMGHTPDPAFKVSGSVNLGNFDLQEQQRQASEGADRARRDGEASLKAEREKREAAEQALYQERVESLRSDFNTKIGQLTQTIEKLATAPQRDERPIHEQFKDQFHSLQDLAKELGMERTQNGQDPMIQLELAKLNYQQAREDREFKRQMRDDEKRWQLEMQKLQDTRDYQRAQLNQQAKKDDMVASLPEHIGAAIGRGLRDRSEGGQPPASQRVAQQPPKSQAYSITLAPGQELTVPCPNCQTTVGLGPDTELAQCVGCDAQFLVKRRGDMPAQPSVDNFPTEEEE